MNYFKSINNFTEVFGRFDTDEFDCFCVHQCLATRFGLMEVGLLVWSGYVWV